MLLTTPIGFNVTVGNKLIAHCVNDYRHISLYTYYCATTSPGGTGFYIYSKTSAEVVKLNRVQLYLDVNVTKFLGNSLTREISIQFFDFPNFFVGINTALIFTCAWKRKKYELWVYYYYITYFIIVCYAIIYNDFLFAPNCLLASLYSSINLIDITG